ncbi:hypothetical protein CW357_12305 [Rummeliibacillus sp. TYF005]|uniref:hypothetical protein n=1 Tax=unclassified Rummeliibacillus TaxID=2622809 RepID=UPI000E672EAF|nr:MULTISPECIES: hypothetical protein [unclassified Rummeliibacillus]RIJ64435.1 hypothetical protein D1606_10380 [Rummeliibacillus sp. POC4]RPJ95057.1 hypothetical protein CW357_12305 [Rummeliibacillus sp. TYF005]
MPTKIAVISSLAFKDRLISISQEVENIQLEFYIYNTPDETPKLMKTIKPCDVLLFSGTLPYLYAKPLLTNWPIPWTYLKQDEFAISTSILSVLAKHHIQLSQLSIDVINSKHVKNVLDDIEYNGSQPFVQEIHIEEHFNMIYQRHRKLWDEGKIRFVITSIHSIYDALIAEGIPAMRMHDSNSSIIHRLEETKVLSKMTKSESAKAVVGILEFSESNEDEQLILQKVVTATHASYQKMDTNHFELFTTFGHIQNAFQHNLLESTFNITQYPIKLTFGYGESILEAQENAKRALDFALPNAIYIMSENKELQGPFPNQPIVLSLQTKDPYVLQMAKETKLSPLNISKIMAFSVSRQSLQFTAVDLAKYLQVTRRSTERILKKLVEHGYAKVVGEEMSYQQGRPRAIYELNFSTYH